MKAIPVLENVYSRIDIVDYENGSFVKQASVYLLGSAAKYVKTIDDVSVKNKQLVSAIGIDVIKELVEKRDVTGGADDWDELDEMDFEELLNSESDNVIQNQGPTTKKVKLTGDLFQDLVFYSKDKAANIRDKIALATGIKPYKQYIWFPNQKRALTNDEVSMMSYWSTSIRSIEGYPIDSRRVFPSIHSVPTIESFSLNKAVVITCINLDSIVGNKSKLQMIARTDSESFELVHMNAIERFFPLMNISVFNQYLADESQIEIRFDSYEFEKRVVSSKYQKLANLIPELNEQKSVDVDSTDLFTISTTDMVIARISPDSIRRIDTLKLFQMIDTTKHQIIASIDLYRYNENRQPIRLRKLQQRDQFRISKDEGVVCSRFHSRKQFIQSRSIVIRLLPTKEYEGITIMIEESGSIWIHMLPSQSFAFTKNAFLNLVAPSVDSIIQNINIMDPVFLSNDRFSNIQDAGAYNIVSSSSKIAFMFSVSYVKLLDLVADKLLSSGLLIPMGIDWNKRQRAVTSFGISYGVSESSCNNAPTIDIKDISSVAVLLLSNLDVDETNLYADILGRLIISARSKLELNSKETSDLSTVDPLLFRPRVSSDGYSRVCQKKYQPVIVDKTDKSAIEYYNFTFNRPEYYKCSTKRAPQLGFITGKHPQGYCLPCCRKMKQPDFKNVQQSCISNSYEEKSVTSTYKIDYPIIDVPNSKIIDRRITLPDYVSRLLGLQNVVANGSILASHKSVRDGSNSSTNSFLQTVMMISCLETSEGKVLYKSYREFVLDVIAMIKEPTNHIQIMKNAIVSERFTSPQALIHAIEDKFIKMTILESSKQLSSIEWNDLFIFLANCMNMNVLLLSDDRLPDRGIQLLNFEDIDPKRPVFILLKRLNVEWSMKSHNTRSLYFPVTKSSFKVFHKSQLIFNRLDTGNALIKLRSVLNGSEGKFALKQFSYENIQALCDTSSYKILDNLLDQKMAIIKTGKTQFLSTIFSSQITINPMKIEVPITSTLNSVLCFITDYNDHAMDGMKNKKRELESYRQYLTAVLKISNVYQFIDLPLFLVKLSKFIIHENNVIGCIVNIMSANKIVSTELMFFKPTTKKAVLSELSNQKSELSKLVKKINAEQLITYPLDCKALLNEEKSFVTWLLHPLFALPKDSKKCSNDLKTSLDIGWYQNEIYPLMAKTIFDKWKQTRISSLDNELSNFIKSSKELPIGSTKIDEIIAKIAKGHLEYDPTVLRLTLLNLFSYINTTDKTIEHALTRLKEFEPLNGFDLKNIHRLTKQEVQSKVNTFMKEYTVKTKEYPTFDTNISIRDQRHLFFAKKKILIHESMFNDIVDMFVSDLTNPFRRDYVINAQLAESALTYTQPHIGELIYVYKINI